MSNKNPCSCIGENFSLILSVPNSEVVVIHDLSDWVVEEGFVFPDFYVLDVLYPNKETKKIEVSPKYGYTIPLNGDGIYEFSLNNCGVMYTQKRLILSDLECRLDQAILEVEDELPKIKDIFDDLYVAKAAAEIGNYSTAINILNKAEQKLENISCNCSCK